MEKLKIDEKKFDINLQFYFLQKQVVKAKLTETQVNNLISSINPKNFKLSIQNLESFIYPLEGDKRDFLSSILNSIKNQLDLLILLFTLKLFSIRALLLQEAKLKDVTTASQLSKLNPLSLEYDNLSVKRPYTTRVNGALLSLLFFSNIENGKTNFMAKESQSFLKDLSSLAKILKKKGLEPNQIFMLMFTESMNQSIISESGGNYEDRILSVLVGMGIPAESIAKTHDKADASTEFDFFFELDGKTYGIGAKRTLRERYKQFIKTAQTSKINVMIEITLGLDLNEPKAQTIRKHGTYIFVADEVYNSRKFLQKIKGVYSVKKLTLPFLKSLN
jgi:hypothetical protein